MKLVRIWGSVILLVLLAACASTTQVTPTPKASPSPIVLPSPLALAWQQECGLGSPLPPVGLLAISVMPKVVASGVDGAQAQTWANGLMRSFALEKWADGNNQDTVIGSGCLKGVLAASDDVIAIARAKANGGSVDYESGSITTLTVTKVNAKEKAMGAKGDDYVIEAAGTGPAGLWVVDAQGLRTAQGGIVIEVGQSFKVLYLGRYDSAIGVWVQDAVIACSTDTPCS